MEFEGKKHFFVIYFVLRLVVTIFVGEIQRLQ